MEHPYTTSILEIKYELVKFYSGLSKKEKGSSHAMPCELPFVSVLFFCPLFPADTFAVFARRFSHSLLKDLCKIGL